MQVDMDDRTRALFTRYVPDEDLRELGHQALGVLRLALDRALAHEGQPAHYPLPTEERSLEHALFVRISQLSPATRQAISERACERITAGALTRAQRYGLASGINPHASDSVERALPRLVLPSPLRTAALRARMKLALPSAGAAAPAAVHAPATGVPLSGFRQAHGVLRDAELLRLSALLTLGTLSGWLGLTGPFEDAATPAGIAQVFALTTVVVDGFFAPLEDEVFPPQRVRDAA